jgi:predicted ATP-dependent serine protease|tara:strand:+ start:17282 stop:18082 length:801 start_codon:yes stop_codon:yes gene_type:complete
MSNSVKLRKNRKQVGSGVVTRFKPTTMKMDDFTFDPQLFVPMKTGTKIDALLSSEGGMMKGTNVAFVGDPGVGKTTVLLDILSNMKKNGSKVLFISGEMNQIDMVGMVKRFPKFGNLPILFMGDWIENDPLVIIKSILSEGWDSVLIDSFAELAVAVVDFHGGTMKNAETKLLNLFEKHNKGENQEKRNTNFMIIQQVTKGGEFAGSNRFKHMITAMAHMKFTPEGSRAIWFSKNRRGGEMNKQHFSLDQSKHVGWLFTEPMNMGI